ncbi:Superfamily II DNA and RNA helicase [Granulibacter bethesdensis]|uniref:Superfamily II DNA and RNA helicase n=2 Tax=Granulibacter bethesdensis TaxID=364410 RepID=A0AAC9KF17_9PROT|nr:Superfamily II DNA and RNA helicase [Granulibacter bethesdensis]APH62576.1 Superfamily II DNA and RNA helicase [Granulibacter bethesdensis]
MASSKGTFMPVVLPPFPWAKFAEPDCWLPLITHLGDVGDCFEALLNLPLYRARLAAIIEKEPDHVTIQRLCALAFLHDIGKLSSGFQAKILTKARTGHLLQGYHALWRKEAGLQDALGLGEDISQWGEAMRSLFLAALAHHGKPIMASGQEPVKSDWAARTGYNPAEAARAIGQACRARYPDAFGPGPELPLHTELQHFFAGLVALADQIGSRECDFPLDRTTRPATKAADVLRNINMDVFRLRQALKPVEPWQLFGWAEGTKLRPMQQALLELSLDIRLAALESETGSGKTEAAFLRFLRLFRAGLVDGLYFAVPTRAAAAQLHRRINHAVQAAFGGECFLALPGYMKAGTAEGWALPGYRVEWADNPDEAQKQARWAAEASRRFLAAPVAVGTVDQVMLSGLQVKWSHFRSAALARSYLVIDEVHASDSYMSAVMDRIVQNHVAHGGHALLMSATLGSATRASLLGAKKTGKADSSNTIQAPYPSLSWAEGEKKKKQEIHLGIELTEYQKTVSISTAPLIAKPHAIASMALEAARQGARVLVIRNTVDQVIATQQAIEALDANAPTLSVNGIRCPHHSRFAAEDRLLLDHAVEQAMGKHSVCGGRIICGSQTVEQSLDIDADFMITDLCPIDVLLQRIGRLHRHAGRHDRPDAFRNARCIVLVPEALSPEINLLHFGLGISRDGGGVYTDLTGLEAVRRIIGEGAIWTIPQDNRRLVEAGTDPKTLTALAEQLGNAWTNERNVVVGGHSAQGTIGRMNLIDRTRAFDGSMSDCFPDDTNIVTRLGADRTALLFAPETIGPFGEKVTQIFVPGHWVDTSIATATGAEWIQPSPEQLVFDPAGLSYTRFGLTRSVNT